MLCPFLVVQDNGRATVLDKSAKRAYSLGEAVNAAEIWDGATWLERLRGKKPSASRNTMQVGEILTPGKAIYSPNLYYRIKIGADGAVLVESAWGTLAWRMHTRPLESEQSNKMIRPANSKVALGLLSDGRIAVAEIDPRLGWAEKYINPPPEPEPTGPLLLRLLDTGALQVVQLWPI